ncbi:hypothetical protein [Spiroplasma endosymbiont of Atherix ibis]|uniref:hypothetical protein n=1 Tax=Spiroplasma endosymbiont of Atherix ibis TaxID=3066291 RepID=UPI0030D07943
MNKWKDKWFYFEILLSFSIFLCLVYVYFDHMINEYWLGNINFPFSPVVFQGQFFSFFTYQSNFIVAIFLLLSVFYRKSLKTCKSEIILLSITSYITVTAITYTFILLPSIIISNKSILKLDLTFAIFFHIISPGLMIFYCVKHVNLLNITISSYFKKYIWVYLIYPWSYTLFLVVRLIMYSLDPIFIDLPIEIIYPYSPPLWASINSISEYFEQIGKFIFLILIFFIFMHILFISINIFYFFILRLISKKKK